MGKKFIYNVLLNVGIISMVFAGVSAFKKDQLVFVIIALVIIVLLIFLKIRLLKQVREITKDNTKP